MGANTYRWSDTVMNARTSAARAKMTNSELAAKIMQPALDAASRRLLQALKEIDMTRIKPLEETIVFLLRKPHGCIYCDYGTLRRKYRQDTEHDDDCGFAMAERLGFVVPA